MNDLIVVGNRAVAIGGGTQTIGNVARTRCLVSLDFPMSISSRLVSYGPPFGSSAIPSYEWFECRASALRTIVLFI
jgi:hypothetical protein